MTDVAVGEPLGVSVWLVPVTVMGPVLERAVLLAFTSVSDRAAPTQPEGIDASAMLVTTFAVTVHEIEMPDKVPHEVTLAVPLTTFFVVGVVPAASALPPTPRTSAAAVANAETRRIRSSR